LAYAEQSREAAKLGLVCEPSPPPLRWWSFKSMASGDVLGTWHIGRRIVATPAGLVRAATWKEALEAVGRA
jgi:hypothetical protein